MGWKGRGWRRTEEEVVGGQETGWNQTPLMREAHKTLEWQPSGKITQFVFCGEP